jgi:UPF0755 protein
MVAGAAFFGGAIFAAFRSDLIAFGRRPGGRDVGARIVVTVARGATPVDVGLTLEEAGVVVDGRDFTRWLVRVAKAEQTIKAGTYVLSPEMTPEEVLAELQKGLQSEVRFTVPEGFDQLEIADVLSEGGFGDVDDILEIMTDPDFIAECGVPDDVPGGVEGYLFPDTYQFPPGTPVRRILRRMRTRLDEVLDDDVKAKMQARGLSLHETLTMASLVEEEAAVGRERRRIAGVFHRRLKKGMKLQTDPTVLYGVEPRDPDQPRRIRRSDLQREHAYNTYTNTGLPPGPISSPGLASIRAAVAPDDDDSLFFVARGDGTHEFCATLACHEEAVGRFILGVTPPPAAAEASSSQAQP